MSWTDLHKFAEDIFGITKKPLYISSSSFVKQYITNKEFFPIFFVTWRANSHYFQNRKNKTNFLINLFWNILYLKEFLACYCCPWPLFRLAKSKKRSGTSFWCIFSAWFFHKYIRRQDFNAIPFFLLKIWNKMSY